MANIITILEKEIEKNNLYVDEKGNTLNPEKIEYWAKKSYVSDLKAGVIGFDKTFESYHADILVGYMPIASVINVVKDTIMYGDEVVNMPEPCTAEPVTENVAN